MKNYGICSNIFYRSKLCLPCRFLTVQCVRRHFHQPSGDTDVLISTPIFYVNSNPHIGHLYTAVLADTLTRWRRLQGRHVTFSTGTDEHGLKIQRAAAASQVPPQQFCDQISSNFKELFDKGNVKYSDYIRTTEKRHKDAVHAFWRQLMEKDYIYKGAYEGWYSVSDEAFLSENDVEGSIKPDGTAVKVSKESGHVVEWIKEENYMFRLSQFSPQLLKWLDKKVIYPAQPYEARVREWVESGLDDLSVSRHSDRLSWGIRVPDDHTQTIYVWLDALTNYLTVSGYPGNDHHWNTAYHLVGKDILRFHAVYWPAFLMAAGLPPPAGIYCHAHWLMDHRKMSKSLGNVVDPFESVEKYSSDGLRYFLLSQGVPHSDGNYSEDRLIDCINSEVVNTMGNLLSRSCGAKVNRNQELPRFSDDAFHRHSDQEDREFWDALDPLRDTVSHHFENFEIYKGVHAVMTQLRDTNRFVDKHEPWNLVKDASETVWLDTVLHVSLNTLRVCGILLQPVIPDISANLLSKLNVPSSRRTWDHARKDCYERVALGDNRGVLMSRLDKKLATAVS